MWSVTTRPSAAAPRNSSRSLECDPGVSAHPERCAMARARSSSSSNRRRRRSLSASSSGARDRVLEPADDVIDRVADRLQVLEVLVLDPEADGALAELLLDGLDELDQRQGVRL